MKYIKIILGTLVVSALACITSVFATTKNYNITLKELNATTTVGPQTKQTTVRQAYENKESINSCTSNYNSVKVRVYSEDAGYSDWMTVSRGAKSYWKEDSKTTGMRAYNLDVKNGTITPCKAYHFSTWYLDNN